MPDLLTEYMGLTLPSPIIVGSSSLTKDVESVVKCAKAGAGAVVLKSIFEEQITNEVDNLIEKSSESMWHPEASEYIINSGQENSISRFLDLIEESKKRVDIPIIASIHCISAGRWTEFAKRIQEAGADAIELNTFILPSDPRLKGSQVENLYLDILGAVKAHTSIPVALKLGPYFSSLANTILELDKGGADGLTLFNRFFNSDIDIENMKVTRASFISTPVEHLTALRWMVILAGRTKCDLCAGCGIHDSSAVIKQLLAGACAVQVVSTLYKFGIDQLTSLLDGISEWMGRHGFESINDFRGKMSQDNQKNPADFERVQFMKFSVGIE